MREIAVQVRVRPLGSLFAIAIGGLLLGLAGSFALFHPGIGLPLASAVPLLADPELAWGVLLAGYCVSALFSGQIAIQAWKQRTRDGAALAPQPSHLALRPFFVVTALPLFVLFYVMFFHLLFGGFPDLGEILPQSQVAGAKTGGPGRAAVVLIPTALAFWYWYRVVGRLDQAIRLFGSSVLLAAGMAVGAATGLGVSVHLGGLLKSPEDRRSAMPSSRWMTAAELQREFDIWSRKGFYPREFHGRCDGDGQAFRADWRADPPRAGYYAYFGLTREDYERKDREFVSRGLARESSNQFKDCSGIDKYQGTWIWR